MSNGEHKLNAKQVKFIDEYLIDLNATQAAIRAGYSEETAAQQSSRLLTKVKIKEFIKSRQDALAEKMGISQEWVVDRFKEISDRCMQVAPVLNRKGEKVLVENKDGEMVPAFVFDSSGANKSTEMLGKHLGMFNEKVDINVIVDTAKAIADARKRAGK